jgi:predicted nucleotidyltransferase
MSSASGSARETIEKMARVIVERFHPLKIILFGSHARGGADADSDVDLLIVMPTNGSKREQRLAIRAAVGEFALPKDIVVVTPDEFEAYRDAIGTIVRPAVREGVVLHDEAA